MKNYNNEGIEWSRVWRESAASETKRVLLIGDSIIDGSKSLIGKHLAPDMAITAYVTSKGLNNPYFIKELSLLCEQEDFAYEAVYLNSGLHFHGQSAEEYKQNYERLVSDIRALMPSAPIIIGASTPWTEGNAAAARDYDTPLTLEGEVRFHERNNTVKEYNVMAKKVAESRGLEFFDAYTLMLENTAHKAPDGVHYTAEGYRILAEKIAETVKKAVGKGV